MTADDLEGLLAFARGPAVDRLLLLMGRVKIADLTTHEIIALVSAFEAADQRMGADTAPVLALIARDEVRQP